MAGFDEQRLADGSITKLCMENAKTTVSMRNWREEEEVFVFNDPIGMEIYGGISAALSHGTDTADDPFLIRSCIVCDDNPEDFRCFSFFSAWSDDPIIKIIARSFELVKT